MPPVECFLVSLFFPEHITSASARRFWTPELSKWWRGIATCRRPPSSSAARHRVSCRVPKLIVFAEPKPQRLISGESQRKRGRAVSHSTVQAYESGIFMMAMSEPAVPLCLDLTSLTSKARGLCHKTVAQC